VKNWQTAVQAYNDRCVLIDYDVRRACVVSESRPCDFEDPQQSRASEHAEADRVHDLVVDEHRFGPAADDDDEVKPVEHGAEVSLEADGVHLYEHLKREQRDEEVVGNVCNNYCIKTTTSLIRTSTTDVYLSYRPAECRQIRHQF